MHLRNDEEKSYLLKKYMKFFSKTLIFLALIIFSTIPVRAENLANRLKGKILLQVESHGEAWYVNPKDEQKYYMANGDEAYKIMRYLGVGITNIDLDRIKNNIDFAKKNSGKIFLQVEEHGEAYYIDFKGTPHYLRDGNTAYLLMKNLGMGITNKDLNKINSSILDTKNTLASKSQIISEGSKVNFKVFLDNASSTLNILNIQMEVNKVAFEGTTRGLQFVNQNVEDMENLIKEISIYDTSNIAFLNSILLFHQNQKERATAYNEIMKNDIYYTDKSINTMVDFFNEVQAFYVSGKDFSDLHLKQALEVLIATNKTSKQDYDEMSGLYKKYSDEMDEYLKYNKDFIDEIAKLYATKSYYMAPTYNSPTQIYRPIINAPTYTACNISLYEGGNGGVINCTSY